MRPRLSGFPGARRRRGSSSSTAPWRPTAKSRASPETRFLLSRLATTVLLGRWLFNAFDLFAEPQRDAGIAQVVAQSFDNLAVGEFKQAVALFDERDAYTENGEHARVLDADHAATDHDHGLGQRVETENLIAVEDGFSVDGNFGRCRRGWCRPRSRCDRLQGWFLVCECLRRATDGRIRGSGRCRGRRQCRCGELAPR